MINKNIAVILILLQILIGCSDLRSGKQTLRKQYLSAIPIGSDYEVVNSKIQKTIDLENISYHKKMICSVDDRTANGNIILVYMGWHLDFILPVDTYTKWCFNKDNKLVDLIIIQETDSF